MTKETVQELIKQINAGKHFPRERESYRGLIANGGAPSRGTGAISRLVIGPGPALSAGQTVSRREYPWRPRSRRINYSCYLLPSSLFFFFLSLIVAINSIFSPLSSSSPLPPSPQLCCAISCAEVSRNRVYTSPSLDSPPTLPPTYRPPSLKSLD